MKKNFLNLLIAFAILSVVIYACKPEANLISGTTVKGTFTYNLQSDSCCSEYLYLWYPNVIVRLKKMNPIINIKNDTFWVEESKIAEIKGKANEEFQFINVQTGNHYQITADAHYFMLNNIGDTILWGHQGGVSNIFKITNESEKNIGGFGF